MFKLLFCRERTDLQPRVVLSVHRSMPGRRYMEGPLLTGIKTCLLFVVR
jgi:hypothetical protein